jgi:hypothetical protein
MLSAAAIAPPRSAIGHLSIGVFSSQTLSSAVLISAGLATSNRGLPTGTEMIAPSHARRSS